MNKDVLRIDLESYSEVNLLKEGLWVYANHPSTEILMVAYRFNDGPVKIWSIDQQEDPPQELLDGITNLNIEKRAYNAAFEGNMFEGVWGIPYDWTQWKCTMVEALSLGFPGKLATVLKAIGLSTKDERGERLINRFSKPAPTNHKADRYDWTTHPADWQAFKEYCIQDVVVEGELADWMEPYKPMSWPNAWESWYLDQKINRRGIHIDIKMAKGALAIWEQEKKRLKEEFLKITGLEKMTREPFLVWLKEQGHEVKNTQADTINKLKESLDVKSSSTIIKALDFWSQYQMRAIDKYKAALRTANTEDERARYTLQFLGASHTGRWGGRGLQTHNFKRSIFPKSYLEQLVFVIRNGNLEGLHDWMESFCIGKYSGLSVADVLSTSIRHVIQAIPGTKLISSDFGSVESRVLGWRTDCTRINECFSSGRDTYRDFATEFYNVLYEDVTYEQRNFCKPATLGCGFRLGGAGLVKYAEKMGIQLSLDDAFSSVETFRRLYKEIPWFWEWLDEALIYVIETGNPIEDYRLRIEIDGDFLKIQLPSGRYIHYFKPELRPKTIKYINQKGEDATFHKDKTFTYMGLNDKNQWVRLYVHSGLITGNVTQGTARDLLDYVLLHMDEEDIYIIFHVHDEVIAEEDEDILQKLLRLMKEMPSWADDLLMDAAGWQGQFYLKD